MRERFFDFLRRVRDWWLELTVRRRILYLSIALGVLLISLVLTLLLNRKDYVVLFDDLTNTESAGVIAALNDANVPYTVDGMGNILVERRNEGAARLQLAELEFSNVGFKYPIALSGGLTETAQDKQRRELYDLQDRLAAAIQLYPEVEKAVVTISLPEKTMFALQSDNTPATAAVVITKKPGRKLTSTQLRGILNIVRDSVSGLSDANISITDETGDLKSSLNFNEEINNAKLALTREVNESIRQNVLRTVQPVYGVDNVEVVVSTTLDTNSKTTDQTTYIPFDETNPANNPIASRENERQKSGDGFGVVGGVVGAQDNVGTPQYAAEEADAAASNYYYSHDIYNYLVSSVRDQIVKDGFEITAASISVLINSPALPDGEKDQIYELANKASGIAREYITVQNIQFRVPIVTTTPGTDPAFQRVLWIAIIGLVALTIIMVMIALASARKKKRLAAEAAAAGEAVLELDEYGNPLLPAQEDEDFEPISLQETPEQKLKLQIKDLAESDPEIVAGLIKTWLVSSN